MLALLLLLQVKQPSRVAMHLAFGKASVYVIKRMQQAQTESSDSAVQSYRLDSQIKQAHRMSACSASHILLQGVGRNFIFMFYKIKISIITSVLKFPEKLYNRKKTIIFRGKKPDFALDFRIFLCGNNRLSSGCSRLI